MSDVPRSTSLFLGPHLRRETCNLNPSRQVINQITTDQLRCYRQRTTGANPYPVLPLEERNMPLPSSSDPLLHLCQCIVDATAHLKRAVYHDDHLTKALITSHLAKDLASAAGVEHASVEALSASSRPPHRYILLGRVEIRKIRHRRGHDFGLARRARSAMP